jgi:hypothetical protein
LVFGGVVVIQTFDEHQNILFAEHLLGRRHEHLGDRYDRVLMFEERIRRKCGAAGDNEQSDKQQNAPEDAGAPLGRGVERREMLTQPTPPQRYRKNRTRRGQSNAPGRSRRLGYARPDR